MLFAACASGPEPLFDPGEPSPELAEKLRLAEGAYRAEHESYPSRRDELAADPVGACWLTRLFVRDILIARESRDLGVDHHLLRAAAKRDDRTEVRAFAEIQQLGVAAAPTVLEDLVKSRQTMLRELGIELAARLGTSMRPALLGLALHAEERHRRAAARGLAASDPRCEDPATRSALDALLRDPEFGVRGDAALALAGAGPAAGPALRATLAKDEDPFVRRKAAEALGRVREKESAQALIDYLQRCKREREGTGETYAQNALQSLAGTKLPRTVDAWRRWLQDWDPAAAAAPSPAAGPKPGDAPARTVDVKSENAK